MENLIHNQKRVKQFTKAIHVLERPQQTTKKKIISELN